MSPASNEDDKRIERMIGPDLAEREIGGVGLGLYMYSRGTPRATETDMTSDECEENLPGSQLRSNSQGSRHHVVRSP